MSSKSTLPRSLGAGLLLMIFCVTAPLAAQERVAFRAKEALTGAGPKIENPLMLVVDGRIEAIRSGGAVPAGYRLVDLGDVSITAGMIDVASKATAVADLSESSKSIELASEAADVLVAGHRDLGLLRESGITSVVVLPEDTAVISGFGAVVKTTDSLDFVARKGPLALALTNGVTSDRQFPTSFMGALQLLGDTLAKPASAEVKELRDGKRVAFCRTATELELRGALRVTAALSCKLALITDGSLRRVLEAAKGRELDIVLPALNLDSPKRDLLLPALAVAQGHKVAFNAGSPVRTPEALRLGAALAIRNGMSPEAAWAAISSEPARMAGVADRIGRLAVGCDADFLVFSGHPTDLSSVLHRTYIGGKLVYTRPLPKEKADS